ncbi:MAG: redoxin family protein [SAR324 cluster bacterium]|nr:redoxin family protein [SAR324 cluster bacterium]
MKKIIFILILGLAFLANSCDKPTQADIDTQKPVDFLDEMGLLPEKHNQPLPPLEYITMRGKTVSTEALKGKVVFLNFWATWCVPCKREMPDMEELHALMKGKDFHILAISLHEPKAKVTYFLKQFPYAFQIGMDPKNVIGKALNINALPTTFIIDKKGIIRATAVGPRRWKDPKFIEYLETLSKE